jgi:Cu-Zn family superoxide dismutase
MAIATRTEREVMRARADMRGDKITGMVEFVEVERDTQRFVRISIRVQGDPAVITPGLHAVHIHERGSCEHGDPPFMSAMGHFDPGPAGNTDPDVNHPFHMGDLPNIRIGPDGSGVLEALSTRITLSDGPLCILSGEGTALMLHGKEDPYRGGPAKSGVSGGPRLACGVIQRTESTRTSNAR